MPSNDLSHLIPAGAEVLEFSTAAVQDKWDPIAYQRHAQREKKKDVRVGCACVMLLPGGCSLRAARPGQGGCTAVQFTDAPGGDCVPDKPYCEAQAPDPHPGCTGAYTLRTARRPWLSVAIGCAQAAAQELELAERRAAGQKTKAQTWGKYGW